MGFIRGSARALPPEVLQGAREARALLATLRVHTTQVVDSSSSARARRPPADDLVAAGGARARAPTSPSYGSGGTTCSCLVDTNCAAVLRLRPLITSWFHFVPVLECGAPEVPPPPRSADDASTSEGIMLVEFATAEELEGEWWFDPARLHTADELRRMRAAEVVLLRTAKAAGVDLATDAAVLSRASNDVGREMEVLLYGVAGGFDRKIQTHTLEKNCAVLLQCMARRTPSTPASSSGGRTALRRRLHPSVLPPADRARAQRGAERLRAARDARPPRRQGRSIKEQNGSPPRPRGYAPRAAAHGAEAADDLPALERARVEGPPARGARIQSTCGSRLRGSGCGCGRWRGATAWRTSTR